MYIVKYRKIFYVISGILMLGSVAAMFVWGLNPSIDFKGGSILEINYATTRPEVSVLNDALAPLSLGQSVRPTGDKGYIIRLRDVTEAERVEMMKVLSSAGNVAPEVKRFDSVGPLLGREALLKSLLSIIMVLIAIVLFVTFAFRKVSEPVASWKYGLITIFALLHDVLVPAGVFAFLGHFKGFEIDTLFVTALLVILGFSVHDTIVVFDRVRENLKHAHVNRTKKTFEEVVGDSISQTFIRSINTSLTTVLALLVLYFFGPEITKHFSLTLLIGIIVGTYSSIFLGSPLLVTVEKWQHKG
ncbi:MAG: Protein translocase subunit SecF [Parcubacteria group bacterium GW2011_GWA2_47_16]|nr:MAG: Protein translocase subunit SecF [Parcubacteria group bacterium GW2011_GWA2_47_16]